MCGVSLLDVCSCTVKVPDTIMADNHSQLSHILITISKQHIFNYLSEINIFKKSFIFLYNAIQTVFLVHRLHLFY